MNESAQGQAGESDLDLDADVFRAVVESSINPFLLLDTKGFVQWVSPRIEELLGEPAADYVGRHFLDTLDPKSQEIAIAAFEDFVDPEHQLAGWIGPPMVLELIDGTGNLVPCEVSAAMGTPQGIDGVVVQIRRSRSITLLYDAVDAIALGAPIESVLTRLAALVEHDTPGSSAVIAWGWDGNRFESSAPAGNKVGVSLTTEHPWPTPWADAIDADSVQGGGSLHADYPRLAAMVSDSGYATCWVIPITVRGDSNPTAAVLLWRTHPGGAAPHRTATARRIARLAGLALEAERNTSSLEQAATTDALTGLDNRIAQRRTLTHLLKGSNAPRTAVLFCDLDDFKPVNDEHGHEFGDRVLMIAARRMEDAIRTSDHLARWGGDEFIVTCAAHDEAEITGLAQRLIDTVSAPIVLDGTEVKVGLSVGIAHAGHVSDADALLQRADDALRDAKSAGKNRWCTDTPASQAAP